MRQEQCSENDPRLRLTDYKSTPPDVLELVDEQLMEFGLEVVTCDTGGDNYAWRVDFREDEPSAKELSKSELRAMGGGDPNV